jgi:hypothetical protein
MEKAGVVATLCIREASVRILAGTPAVLIEVCHGFV